MRTEMTCMRNALLLLTLVVTTAAGAEESPWLGWEDAEIRVGNDRDGFFDVVKGRRMLNDMAKSGGTMHLPYFARDPDGGRLLFVCSDSGRKAGSYLMESTDEGETWKVLPTSGAEFKEVVGLAACGNGVLLASDGLLRSVDGGRTWTQRERVTDPRFGTKVHGWDPPLVVRGSGGRHVLLTGFSLTDFGRMSMQCQPLLSESLDAGATWSPWRGIPEFGNACEVALAYNAKGEILAGIRRPVVGGAIADDHFCQLLTSVSSDGGKTWSLPKVAAGCGRHHPSFATLPDGRVVLTYVVRMGYPKEDGKFAYGIEAVISYDDGRTWDLDHRYILAKWTNDCIFTDSTGAKVPLQHYMGAPQCTTTVCLPKSGELLTAYGTGQDWRTITADMRYVHYRTGVLRWKPMNRTAYTNKKVPAPAPVPADVALSALRGKRDWAVAYDAGVGCPDGGWVCHYAQRQFALTNGFLRIDHRKNNRQSFVFRGPDLFEMMNGTYAFRARLRVPSCTDAKDPVRLVFNAIVDTGREKNEFCVRIGYDLMLDGTFGLMPLPVKSDEPFLLEIWADKPSRTARIWVNGKLVGEKPFSPRYVPAETGAGLYFGSGYNPVDGLIDIGCIQFGGLE